MRLISQDKLIDVPYELGIIKRIKEKIYYYVLDKSVMMAEYTTEEKAIKVMEDLQYSYSSYNMFKLLSEEQREMLIAAVPTIESVKANGIYYFPNKE